MGSGVQHRADVVIVTALRLEYEQALLAAREDGSKWHKLDDGSGWPAATRELRGVHGRLRLLLALAPDMGMTPTTALLVSLIERHAPKCIAMCGVCAGSPKDTRLGDVVAADRVYRHDTGKVRRGGVQQDLTTYKLRDDWKLALQALRPAVAFRGRPWFEARPLPWSWRVVRALAAFAQPGSADRRIATDPTLGEAEWATLLHHLNSTGLIDEGQPTPRGQEHLRRALTPYEDKIPDLSPSGPHHPARLHVASMASGNQVFEEQAIWGKVTPALRTTRALEMEAAALGEVASLRREPRLDFLVIKGVMDFADAGRDDHFKEYAARMSAECLLWFLRHHATPHRVLDQGDLPSTWPMSHGPGAGLRQTSPEPREESTSGHAQVMAGDPIASVVTVEQAGTIALHQPGDRSRKQQQQKSAQGIVDMHREGAATKPMTHTPPAHFLGIIAIIFAAAMAMASIVQAL